LRGNKFTGFNVVPMLDTIEYINLRDNQIETQPEAGEDGVVKESGSVQLAKLGIENETRDKHLKGLRKLHMQGNPFSDDAGEGFKREVLIALENLGIQTVNKEAITEEDRADAKEEKAQRAEAARIAAEEAEAARAAAAAEGGDGDGEKAGEDEAEDE
jgi:hypothetical protein